MHFRRTSSNAQGRRWAELTEPPAGAELTPLVKGARSHKGSVALGRAALLIDCFVQFR